MARYAEGNGSSELAAAGLPAVIDLFARACDAFQRSLGSSDDVFDATDFTGSLHELGYNAGRVRALGEALSLMTGSPEWRIQAEEVVAEYLAATVLPEDDERPC